MLDGPFPSMIHDFAVTRNWIVLPVFPLTSSMERAMKGKPPFAWEPDKGTHIAFIPRGGTVADVEWVTAPASYVFHPMNHFETAEGKIVVDVMKYDVAPLFPLPDGSPSAKDVPPARLFRWTFDFSGRSNTFKEEQLDDRAGEFPRFDERFCMSDYRLGWVVAANIADPECRRAAHQRADPLRSEDRQEHGLERQSRRSRRRAGVRAAHGRCARRRRLGAERGLSRRRTDRSDLAVFEATGLDRGPSRAGASPAVACAGAGSSTATGAPVRYKATL